MGRHSICGTKVQGGLLEAMDQQLERQCRHMEMQHLERQVKADGDAAAGNASRDT